MAVKRFLLNILKLGFNIFPIFKINIFRKYKIVEEYILNRFSMVNVNNTYLRLKILVGCMGDFSNFNAN